MTIDLNIPQQVMIQTALDTRLTRVLEMIQIFEKYVEEGRDIERSLVMRDRYKQEYKDVNDLLHTIKAMY